jgi:membrane glycosyltransferase
LFVTPEERKRPEVLVEFDSAMANIQSHPINASDELREPYTQAMHLALLPPEEVLSRRQQHYAQGLLYKTMEDGLHSLSTAEQRELFSRAHSLRELQDWLWSSSSKSS